MTSPGVAPLEQHSSTFSFASESAGELEASVFQIAVLNNMIPIGFKFVASDSVSKPILASKAPKRKMPAVLNLAHYLCRPKETLSLSACRRLSQEAAMDCIPPEQTICLTQLFSKSVTRRVKRKQCRSMTSATRTRTSSEGPAKEPLKPTKNAKGCSVKYGKVHQPLNFCFQSPCRDIQTR